jgi:G3E family GTPase
LKDIAHYLKSHGKKVALVVNDIGKFNIDAERFDDEDVQALTQ